MKHMKFIDCLDCGGHGFITQLNENGQTSVWCMKCQGTGSIAVPMTNGDRIRSMSDEELAEFVCRNSISTMCDIICGGWCNAVKTLKKSADEMCKDIVIKWLQQPAEGGDG